MMTMFTTFLLVDGNSRLSFKNIDRYLHYRPEDYPAATTPTYSRHHHTHTKEKQRPDWQTGRTYIIDVVDSLQHPT